MIFDLDKTLVSAVIGGLIMLLGGFIVFVFVMKNQIPTVGIYIMIIGILIVVTGHLIITIFEYIKRWIVKVLN